MDLKDLAAGVDVQAEVEKLVRKISSDAALQAQFKKDPAGAVKSLVGSELSAAVMDKLVAGVKAKLAGDQLAGAAGMLGKMLGK